MSWSALSSGSSATLRAVWGSGPSDVWMAGDRGTMLHFNGTTVSAVPSGSTADITAIRGRSATEIWALTSDGTILRWDGTTWTASVQPTAQPLYSILMGSTAATTWVVGGRGTILRPR